MLQQADDGGQTWHARTTGSSARGSEKVYSEKGLCRYLFGTTGKGYWNSEQPAFSPEKVSSNSRVEPKKTRVGQTKKTIRRRESRGGGSLDGENEVGGRSRLCRHNGLFVLEEPRPLQEVPGDNSSDASGKSR